MGLGKKLRNGYVQFIEKQGFPIVVTVCVAVITATAVWRTNQQEVYVSPTPPVMEDLSAAQLIQQSLRHVATPTPAPTTALPKWQPPLDQIEVLRSFSTEEMHQSKVTGIWTVHDALDLKADRGTKIRAIADGIVTDSGNDRLYGAWLKIDHGEGIEALYAGMSLPGAFLPGDDVRMGDLIGFSGNGMAEETDLEPHLHLRVTRDGMPLDPLSLWTLQQ